MAGGLSNLDAAVPADVNHDRSRPVSAMTTIDNTVQQDGVDQSPHIKNHKPSVHVYGRAFSTLIFSILPYLSLLGNQWCWYTTILFRVPVHWLPQLHSCLLLVGIFSFQTALMVGGTTRCTARHWQKTSFTYPHGITGSI